jgi:hypothetical protein
MEKHAGGAEAAAKEVRGAPNNHFSGGPAASPARIFGLSRQPRGRRRLADAHFGM